MDDAAVVGGGQAGAELAGGFERLVGREAPDAGEERCQVLAIDVFHGDERHAVDLADVEDAADVGVGNQPRDANLAVKALEEARVAGGLLGEEFESDGLAEGEVGGAVDFAHAAASEESDDAIAAAQQGAGNEAPLVGSR